MKETEVQIPPQVASGLRQLDLETLRHVLDGLLDGSQIKAIDKRRRVLIKELEKRGLM